MAGDDALERAADAAAAGHGAAASPDLARLAACATGDPDPRVRAVALGALSRAAPDAVQTAQAWQAAAADGDAGVRRRAAEVAPALAAAAGEAQLLALLRDPDAWVAEAAAWALGERPATAAAVDALAAAATSPRDALVREAAVAALGALGDPRGLPAVLRACDDKPAVRRRAVLALAAFSGDEVEARLRSARHDRDWQVRQAAEDLERR
jgi:HEAT repeat protein